MPKQQLKKFNSDVIAQTKIFLNNYNDDVRLGSIKTLKLIGKLNDLSVLLASLKDPNIQVRETSFETLTSVIQAKAPVTFDKKVKENWDKKVNEWLENWSKKEQEVELTNELKTLEKVYETN